MTADYYPTSATGKRLQKLAIHVDRPLSGLSGLSSAAEQDGMELTRAQDFVDGHKDIFDLLDSRHAANGKETGATREEDKAETQILDKALGLLSKACDALRRAERHIEEQTIQIENLEELATIDALTGLYNRAGFVQLFARELSRAQRQNGPGGVLVLIEIENYDSLQHNHDIKAAQKAAFTTGRALGQVIRDMDAAARIEENEFLLLLTDTNAAEASERIQRLALELNGMSFAHDGKRHPLHASISMKSYRSGDTIKRLCSLPGFEKIMEEYAIA